MEPLGFKKTVSSCCLISAKGNVANINTMHYNFNNPPTCEIFGFEPTTQYYFVNTPWNSQFTEKCKFIQELFTALGILWNKSQIKQWYKLIYCITCLISGANPKFLNQVIGLQIILNIPNFIWEISQENIAGPAVYMRRFLSSLLIRVTLSQTAISSKNKIHICESVLFHGVSSNLKRLSCLFTSLGKMHVLVLVVVQKTLLVGGNWLWLN